MNSEQMMSFVRQLLTLASGIAMGVGLISSEQASEIVKNLSIGIPALISVASVVWSIYNHWNQKKVPVTATAIDLPPHAALGEPVGTNLTLASGQTVKVVG